VRESFEKLERRDGEDGAATRGATGRLVEYPADTLGAGGALGRSGS
jgi:hypothetical protein